MELQNPEIKTTLRALSDTKYTLTLTTERPALWVWVASTGPDLRFSDNFFHMKAQCPTTIEITAEKPMCVKELTAVLNIRSLYNTY
jgi:beta-galactosidase/beta-glucuronidase